MRRGRNRRWRPGAASWSTPSCRCPHRSGRSEQPAAPNRCPNGPGPPPPGGECTAPPRGPGHGHDALDAALLSGRKTPVGRDRHRTMTAAATNAVEPWNTTGGQRSKDSTPSAPIHRSHPASRVERKDREEGDQERCRGGNLEPGTAHDHRRSREDEERVTACPAADVGDSGGEDGRVDGVCDRRPRRVASGRRPGDPGPDGQGQHREGGPPAPAMPAVPGVLWLGAGVPAEWCPSRSRPGLSSAGSGSVRKWECNGKASWFLGAPRPRGRSSGQLTRLVDASTDGPYLMGSAPVVRVHGQHLPLAHGGRLRSRRGQRTGDRRHGIFCRDTRGGSPHRPGGGLRDRASRPLDARPSEPPAPAR